MGRLQTSETSYARRWFPVLAPADRIRLLIVSFALPLAAWLAWQSSYASERWVVLVREVPAPRVAEMAKYLEGRRIPFEVKGDGHDIWVPADLSAELTIEMDRYIPEVTTERR